MNAIGGFDFGQFIENERSRQEKELELLRKQSEQETVRAALTTALGDGRLTLAALKDILNHQALASVLATLRLAEVMQLPLRPRRGRKPGPKAGVKRGPKPGAKRRPKASIKRGRKPGTQRLRRGAAEQIAKEVIARYVDILGANADKEMRPADLRTGLSPSLAAKLGNLAVRLAVGKALGAAGIKRSGKGRATVYRLAKKS